MKEIRGLLNHPGWVRLREFGDAQMRARFNDVIAGEWNLQNVLEKCSTANQLHGIELFFRLPADYLEDLEIQIDHLKKQIEDREAEEEIEDDEQRDESGSLGGHPDFQ